MTHDELVKKARHWLWTQGCSVVITEMSSSSQEPDAIGFCPTYSILVECKASRQDFLSEKNKPHTRTGKSMGDKRYYLAPSGIIKSKELPKKYGLLQPCGRGITIMESGGWFKEKNFRGEIHLLISAFRRIRTLPPKGTSVRMYFYQTGCRATLGIKPTKPIPKKEGKSECKS